MKDYTPGTWGLSFIFSLEGSIFPQAFTIALPNALLAVTAWYYWHDHTTPSMFEDASFMTAGQVWTAYNWVIGFMVSFRAQRAYSRWWEGGTLLQQARGEWYNAYSNLIAFSSHKEDKIAQVQKFHHILARLVSLLYAAALVSISNDDQSDFEVLDATGFSPSHLAYLQTQEDKCEIVMQWIQRLIIDRMDDQVLTVAPPVISRVFQELSRGIVNIHNVRKITEFQFPFPLAQMIMAMLITHWFMTPIVCGLLVGSPVWACVLSFLPAFALWGINYIASQIEQPFGRDSNDLPMSGMQASMNTSLLALLDPEAQTTPDLDLEQTQLQGANMDNIGVVKTSCSKVGEIPPMRSVRSVAAGANIHGSGRMHCKQHTFRTGFTPGKLNKKASALKKKPTIASQSFSSFGLRSWSNLTPVEPRCQLGTLGSLPNDAWTTSSQNRPCADAMLPNNIPSTSSSRAGELHKRNTVAPIQHLGPSPSRSVDLPLEHRALPSAARTTPDEYPRSSSCPELSRTFDALLS